MNYWWLHDGDDHYEVKRFLKAAEAYQQGLRYSPPDSDRGGNPLEALLLDLGCAWYELALYGEALYCRSRVTNPRNDYIKLYLAGIKEKCARQHIPPILDSSVEYLPGLWYQVPTVRRKISPPSEEARTADELSDAQETRLRALFSPRSPGPNKPASSARFLPWHLPFKHVPSTRLPRLKTPSMPSGREL